MTRDDGITLPMLQPAARRGPPGAFATCAARVSALDVGFLVPRGSIVILVRGGITNARDA